MTYSRRLRVEEKRDKIGALRYVAISIVLVFLLFQFGLPNAVKLIGFISDFRHSEEVSESGDNTPPAPPFIGTTPKETNSMNIEVTGVAESGVTIITQHNGKVSETLSNTEGSFLIPLELDEGENTIVFSSRDKAGNKSVTDTVVRITFDKTPPDVTVESPSDGATFYGDKNKIIEVVGQTEEGAQVTVSGHMAVVGFEGKFKSAVTLENGINEIKIISKDKAGNDKEVVVTVNFSN